MRFTNVQWSDHQSDLAKINKEKRMKIHILMIMDEIEGRNVDYQLEAELVSTEHDLDYKM
jgi:hypothetical protein